MKTEKKYFSIREVSEITNIKEHVIRHWDSIDPKTNKFRIDDLSIRTKGGTRFFSKNHIKKLINLNNLLKENGKRNYSLDLASKIMSKNTQFKNSDQAMELKFNNLDSTSNFKKIQIVTNKLKKLLL